MIWDEVGEIEEDRDKVLYQLDQECLDVYKRKVDQATNSRDLLIQALDDSKIELARLLSALGEKAIARTVSDYMPMLGEFIASFLSSVTLTPKACFARAVNENQYISMHDLVCYSWHVIPT